MAGRGAAKSLATRRMETGCTARVNANTQLTSCARARPGAATKFGAPTNKKPDGISRGKNFHLESQYKLTACLSANVRKTKAPSGSTSLFLPEVINQSL